MLGTQRLDGLVMDLNPEDADAFKQKRKMMVWDDKKKKYVQMMVAAGDNPLKHKKRINEAGVSVAENAKEDKTYELWKKKTKGRIQHEGEEEDPQNFRHRSKKNDDDDDDRGNEESNQEQAQKNGEDGGSGKRKNSRYGGQDKKRKNEFKKGEPGSKKIRDELLNSDQLKAKERRKEKEKKKAERRAEKKKHGAAYRDKLAQDGNQRKSKADESKIHRNSKVFKHKVLEKNKSVGNRKNFGKSRPGSLSGGGKRGGTHRLVAMKKRRR